MNEKLPNWNLKTIYPDFDSEEFEKDYRHVFELSASMMEKMESAPLFDLIADLNELKAVFNNIESYSHVLIATNSTDEKNLLLQAKVQKAELRFDEVEKRFYLSLKNRKDELKDPTLSLYSYVLEEGLREAENLMPLSMELLATELNISGGDAFSRLQDALVSNIEKDGHTLISLRSKAYSSKRSERESAFYKEKELLREHEVAFSYCLNGVKGTVLTLEKKRGYEDPLLRSAMLSRISTKALEALISTLEKNLGFWREYMREKASLLSLDKIDFFDLFAPVGSSEKQYSFADAESLIVDSFSSFSKKQGEFARKAFQENWIDAPLYKGKVGGAFDIIFLKSKQSRVLCNFDHSYDSVSTLAHELGHAFHDSVVLNLPPLLTDYPMPVAETASIFSETLLFSHMEKILDSREKLGIIESMLSGGLQVCVDILSRFYFEKAVFEERKNGDISPKRLSEMMLDAQNRTYGDAMGQKHEYMWAVKGHYYSTDLSYYNYPYAFGQLFALSLYSSGIDEASYIRLLGNTGLMSADDVASSAGFDIKDEKFWQSGMDVFKSYFEKLKECR